MTSQGDELGRDDLKHLVDNLPDSEVHAAIRYLQFLRYHDDSLAWSLDNAPADDEPLTDKDWDAIREANEDIAAGRVISHQEIRKELEL